MGIPVMARLIIPRLGAATLLLFLVLIQPNHPGAMTWGALRVFPLELPAILLALLALGDGRAGRVLRMLLTAVLTLIVVLKSADLVSFNALSRGFNPVADLMLVDAFVRLLAGSVGAVLAGLAVVGAVLAIAAIAGLLWWSMGQWARLVLPRVGPRITPRMLALPALLAGALVVVEVGHTMKVWRLPFNPVGTAFTARLGLERVGTVQRTLAQLAAFRVEVMQDPFTGATDLMDLIDRDVLVIFIESYGRTSFDTPYYSGLHGATLARYQEQLTTLGLSVQSGFLGSPTRGGQSWLAHSTVANGMWIDNQVSYGAALASGRATLFHHAANSGFRTAAVMPQITLDWPEAARMGFEDVLPAADLGYKGLPFNWVTMPDQFTLAALDRLVRTGGDGRHNFAQVVLSSSHAPWVPVPQMVAWDALGDGQMFNEMAIAGDPPDVVWRDRDRVREQYRLAIDYSLTAVMEYAVLHAQEPPLMIVIGDHQAAEFVALDGRADVPIHVIGPAHLVAALSQVAPSPGLVPQADAPVTPMNALRDIVLNAYSTRPPAGARS